MTNDEDDDIIVIPVEEYQTLDLQCFEEPVSK